MKRIYFHRVIRASIRAIRVKKESRHVTLREKAPNELLLICIMLAGFASVRPRFNFMKIRLFICAVLAIFCVRLHAQSNTGIYVNPSNNVGVLPT